MVKTAGTGQDPIKLLAEALVSMGVKANIDIGELLSRIANSSNMHKTAKQEDGSSEETIKIASKRVEDSHFFIDVSKDEISKNGKSLILVCAYMREGYLGRYMIKRNYYFLPDNPEEADEIYGDLVSKSRRIRKRYYSSKIGINDIFPELKSILDATKGDLEFDSEEQIGSAFKRDKDSGHETAGPAYIRNPGR